MQVAVAVVATAAEQARQVGDRGRIVRVLVQHQVGVDDEGVVVLLAKQVERGGVVIDLEVVVTEAAEEIGRCRHTAGEVAEVDDGDAGRVLGIGLTAVGHLRHRADLDLVIAATCLDHRDHRGVVGGDRVVAAEAAHRQALDVLEAQALAAWGRALDDGLELRGHRGVGVAGHRLVGVDLAGQRDTEHAASVDPAGGGIVGRDPEARAVAGETHRRCRIHPVDDPAQLVPQGAAAGHGDGGVHVGRQCARREDRRRGQSDRVREAGVHLAARKNVADRVGSVEREDVGARRAQHIDFIAAGRAAAVVDGVAGLRALECDQVVLVAGAAGVVEHHAAAPVRNLAGGAAHGDAAVAVVDGQDVVAGAAKQVGELEDLLAAAGVFQAFDLGAGRVAIAAIGDAKDLWLGAGVFGGQHRHRVRVDQLCQPLGHHHHGQRIAIAAGGVAVGLGEGGVAGVLAGDGDLPKLPGRDGAAEAEVEFLESVFRGGRQIGLLRGAVARRCAHRDGRCGGLLAPVAQRDRGLVFGRVGIRGVFFGKAPAVEGAAAVTQDDAADKGIAEQRHVLVEGFVQGVLPARVEEHIDAGVAGEAVVAGAAVQHIGVDRADQAVVAGLAQQLQAGQILLHTGGVQRVVAGPRQDRQQVAAAELRLTTDHQHVAGGARHVQQRDLRPALLHHLERAARGREGEGVAVAAVVTKRRALAAHQHDAVVGGIVAAERFLHRGGAAHQVGLGQLQRERRGTGTLRRDHHRRATAAGHVGRIGIHQRAQARRDADQAGVGRGGVGKVLLADGDAPGRGHGGRCGAGQRGSGRTLPELLEHLRRAVLEQTLAAARAQGVGGLVDRRIGQAEALAAAHHAQRDLGAITFGPVVAALIDLGRQRAGNRLQRVVRRAACIDKVIAPVDANLPAVAGLHRAGQRKQRPLLDALRHVLVAGHRAGGDAGVAAGILGGLHDLLLADRAIGRGDIPHDRPLDPGHARCHTGIHHQALDQRALQVTDGDQVGAGTRVELDALDVAAVQRQTVQQNLHAGAGACQRGAAVRVGHAGTAGQAGNGDLIGDGAGGDREDIGILRTAIQVGIQFVAHGPDETIGAGPTEQIVHADTADQAVRTRAAKQRVAAKIAGQAVVAVAAIEPVIAHAAVEQVVTGVAAQHIVALLAVEVVGAVAARQGVAAQAAVKHVIAALAEQQVIALLAEQLVIAFTAVQLVVEVAADQGVVAGVTVELARARAGVSADEDAVMAAAAVQHHIEQGAGRAVDDDLVVVGRAVGGETGNVAEAEVILGAARCHLDVLFLGAARAARQLHLADQEALASGLVALGLGRHAQMQLAIAQRGQDRHLVRAAEREVVEHRGEEGLARAEDGDLGAEDLHPDPEIRIQAHGDVAVDVEDAFGVVQQLVEVDLAVVDRRDGITLAAVVVDVDAGARVGIVFQVEVDLSLDVALDPHLDQAANADTGAGRDGDGQRGLGRIGPGAFDAVVVQEEAVREDDRDVGRLVAAGLELDEAARRQAQRDVGGGADFAGKLGIQAREDREHLLVEELQVERRQVVLEQGHFLAHQQAEQLFRAGQQRKLPGARLGADAADHVLGGRRQATADIDDVRGAGGHRVRIARVACVTADDKVTEVHQQWLARVAADEVVDRLHHVDDFDDGLDRLHHAGVLGLAEDGAGDVQQRVLLRLQLLEQRDFGGQDLDQRL